MLLILGCNIQVEEKKVEKRRCVVLGINILYLVILIFEYVSSYKEVENIG